MNWKAVYLFVFMLMILIVVVVIKKSPDSAQPSENGQMPILIIETGTGKCLTAYEPERRAFHACWLKGAEPRHTEVYVPKGTDTLDIFRNPDYFLHMQQ